MSSAPRGREALLIVDPQVDFCPGGALPVPGGDAIFPAVNEAARHLPVVVASRDWHPADHLSFREQGGPWPRHCVHDTPGAEFHPQLDVAAVQHVVSKGTEPSREAYSAFSGTDLAEWLRQQQVDSVFVAGLATDYCVRQSVLDALSAGFRTTVLEDAVGAVDVESGDGARALREMAAAGARRSTVADLLAHAAQ